MIGGFGFSGRTTMSNLQADMASNAASRANRQAQNVKAQLRILEANLAKAMLINEALLELIREHHNLSEDDLNNKLYEIDMRDGQLDGKNQRSNPTECSNCGRKVSKRHPACIYCGQIMDDSVFNVT